MTDSLSPLAQRIAQHLPAGRWGDAQQTVSLIEAILLEARRAGASDVHLRPTPDALEMAWRLDGVLQPVANLPAAIRANVMTRLKVLAGLLTYHTDRPQEGRLKPLEGETSQALAAGNEMRLSIVPTLFGEKAVVRLFVGSGTYRRLNDLGWPADVADTYKNLLQQTGGLLLISGPAGSGKTTTAYASLRELSPAENSTELHPTEFPSGYRSLVTLEDPIEAVLDGVAQSQVRPAANFDYANGIKALLRQDPDVLLVGEIRDADTASVVFQASLTGHLVLSTFHAGTSAEAVSRLLDMGLEPYQLRSGLLAVLNQRLVRGLCGCAEWSEDPAEFLGFDLPRVRVPRGCDRCGQTGYWGRVPLVELLLPNRSETSRAILERADSATIQDRARAAGMIDHRQRAHSLVATGQTSPGEIRRVLGF